jgi:2-methylcitrate dehydratase PrpD
MVTSNSDAIAQFVASVRTDSLPPQVIEAARMCLVDWFGVALGAHHEGAGQTVHKVVSRWGTSGNAPMFFGGRVAPAAAALVNATLAHCLDYDDTHVGAVAHLSGPTWAAALAVGSDRGASEGDILSAFVAGFEVAARLGSHGLGQALNERGLHSTGVFGCFGAAVAASVLLGLDATGLANALGAAATQVGGLTASFGTMSKPLHAGKAAFNGILAAELAAQGFMAQEDLLEPQGALAAALVQDRRVGMASLDFSDGWELTRNTFKPYASCLLTHPTIEAARRLADAVKGREIAAVTIDVHPMCVQHAAKPAPKTALEGKFSVQYCAALGLNGYTVTARDFSAEQLGKASLQHLVERVTLNAVEGMDMRAAHLHLKLADGTELEAHTDVALGNPENPMSWDDMQTKFVALVEPVLGARTLELFDLLRTFGSERALEQVNAMVTDAGAPPGVSSECSLRYRA